LRPELFPVLRSIVDRTGRKGQALILGSASRTFSARVRSRLQRSILHRADPLHGIRGAGAPGYELLAHWFRGGYPESLLADDDETSNRWRQNFLRTFIERDIAQLGVRITARNLRRLITMLAHSQGQLLNSSKLAASLGVTYHTVRDYIDLFAQAYV
jgi:predicted AAA+ superfamily ATPase